MQEKEAKPLVRIFALASLLHDMGSDMVYAVWPLFITSFLGANMEILGLIDGLGDALVSLSQAVSGYISDRIRRRKLFIWSGYLFGGLAKIGYAFAPSWQWVIPFRIIDRSGKMRGSPRDAMLAQASTRDNRGRNFGIVRMMDNLGSVVGIILAVALFETLGYRRLFALAAVPSLAATLLILLAVKEPTSGKITLYKGLAFKDVSKNFKLFLLVSALFALASFSYSFLLIFAKNAGFGLTTIPLLYLVFNAVAFGVSLYFGKLADRIGRKPVLMLSFGFWALVCVNFIALKSIAMIILAFVLYGLHKGALEPVQKAFVAELAPADYKASTLGAFQLVIGVAALPASLAAGILWDKMGMAIPFYLSLGLTGIAMALLLFVKET